MTPWTILLLKCSSVFVTSCSFCPPLIFLYVISEDGSSSFCAITEWLSQCIRHKCRRQKAQGQGQNFNANFLGNWIKSYDRHFSTLFNVKCCIPISNSLNSNFIFAAVCRPFIKCNLTGHLLEQLCFCISTIRPLNLANYLNYFKIFAWITEIAF